jgi:DNA-binding protein H-NS
MATLQALLAQREALDRQIAEMKESEKYAAITRARALVAEHGLLPGDVFGEKGATRRGPKATGKVAPKYRHPMTGATWTGRGKAPKWLGEDRDKFLISKD